MVILDGGIVVGQPLLNRSGKDVTPTEAGERLLSYARRLLALAEEARDVMTRPSHEGAVRLGVPEDFAAYRLTKLLGAFARSHPHLRLDVRADQSTRLKHDLERGDLETLKKTVRGLWDLMPEDLEARARAFESGVR